LLMQNAPPPKAKTILDNWEDFLPKFWQVVPPSEADSPEVNQMPWQKERLSSCAKLEDKGTLLLSSGSTGSVVVGTNCSVIVVRYKPYLRLWSEKFLTDLRLASIQNGLSYPFIAIPAVRLASKQLSASPNKGGVS